MLLSMYLSYHWARTVKLGSYLTRITLSILVMSFLSIVFRISMFTIVFFPLFMLSFFSWPAIFTQHWGRTYGIEPLRLRHRTFAHRYIIWNKLLHNRYFNFQCIRISSLCFLIILLCQHSGCIVRLFNR